MAAQPVVSVITDEVSQNIDGVIDFMAAHRVDRVDIRAVDGRNVLLFDDRELADLAASLTAAGLTVGCYCSPLLKWPWAGAPVPEQTNFHGFDPEAMAPDVAMARSFEVANALGAEQVRIFSYLRYDGFAPGDLADDLDRLLNLAEQHAVDLVLENEHVCNVATLTDILAVTNHHPHPRLKAAIDVANQLSAGRTAPAVDTVAAVARLGGTVHVKDLDADGRYVPVGEGRIPHRDILAMIVENAPDGPLPIALETHMPHDGWNATAASLRAVREMLRDRTS